MFVFKKCLFAIVVCSVSVAYAVTDEARKGPVNPLWELGGSALYLRPSLGGYVLPGQFQDNGRIHNYINWSPSWGWGFKVDAAHHFDVKNDLNLNGYHLANPTHYSFSNMIDLGAGNPSFRNYRTGSSDVSFNWNAANLELGHTFNFSPFRRVRLHAGAQYNRIATETQSSGIATKRNVSTPFSRILKGNFYGAGPRVGVDALYGWANGFGLYANAATSLLIGNKQFSDTVNNANVLNRYNASYFAIDPGIEAKIGAKFSHSLAQGTLNVDAGWMWVDYVNTLPYRLLLGTTQSATREADFALQGPYIGLTWLGNIA